MNATKVNTLASELSAAFTRNTRTNGDEYVMLRDGSPEWMTDIVHKVHGEKLPDDYVYWFAEMAADAIAEADANEDAMRDAIEEIEPPCYTYQQMKWFAGNYEYCDQAIEEGLWESSGRDVQVTDLVAVGMSLHIREIAYALLDALSEYAETLEETEA